VTLRAGDIVDLKDSSTVSAPNGTVTLLRDYGNADADLGSAINMYGTIESKNQIVATGNSEQDTFNVNPGTGHSVDAAKLDGAGGNDTYNITFGRLDGLLTTGQRRLPSTDDVDAFFSNLFGSSDRLPLLPFEGR